MNSENRAADKAETGDNAPLSVMNARRARAALRPYFLDVAWFDHYVCRSAANPDVPHGSSELFESSKTLGCGSTSTSPICASAKAPSTT
jgi:hypothetical protein